MAQSLEWFPQMRKVLLGLMPSLHKTNMAHTYNPGHHQLYSEFKVSLGSRRLSQIVIMMMKQERGEGEDLLAL